MIYALVFDNTKERIKHDPHIKAMSVTPGLISDMRAAFKEVHLSILDDDGKELYRETARILPLEGRE